MNSSHPSAPRELRSDRMRMLVGNRRDVEAATRAGNMRAVGRYKDLGKGRIAVPVVYVSKRALPWYARRWVHVTAMATGAMLFLAAVFVSATKSVGLGWVVAGVIASAVCVVALNRITHAPRRRGIY